MKKKDHRRRFHVHYHDGVGYRHAVVVGGDTDEVIRKLKKHRQVSRVLQTKQLDHDYVKEEHEQIGEEHQMNEREQLKQRALDWGARMNMSEAEQAELITGIYPLIFLG